jgi:hypothetical protein
MDEVNFVPERIEDPGHWITDVIDEEAGVWRRPEQQEPTSCGQAGDGREHRRQDSLDEEAEGQRQL